MSNEAPTPAHTFLSWFWDLADGEAEKRNKAVMGIISHIKIAQEGIKGEELASDASYAVKRLVRGLASSRASARQGFASCLTQLLIEIPLIETSDVIALLDESTKVTGSFRGSEERDLFFGKAFGCLVLIRAARLEESAHSLKVADWLIELYAKKKWIRELCVEAIMLLLSSLSEDLVREEILPKVKPFLADTPTHEYSPEQLMLAIGLDRLRSTHTSLAEGLLDLLPGKKVVSPATIDIFTSTLLVSSYGFPKIHRVWHYIFREVFGEDQEGNLGALPKRKPLSDKASRLLHEICQIFAKLSTASNEKKGLGMRLTVDLLKLVPSSHISTVVTQSTIRSLMTAAGNKHSVLHHMAINVLGDMSNAVSDDVDCKVALANVLIQQGHANFDKRTGTTTVASLIQGMDRSAIIQQAMLLETVVITGSGPKGHHGELDTEDSKDLGFKLSALEGLIGLLKTPDVSFKWDLLRRMGIFLASLAYLDCRTFKLVKTSAQPESPKKRKKRTPIEAVTFPQLDNEIASMVEALSSIAEVSDELALGAARKLNTILGDMGHLTQAEICRPKTLKQDNLKRDTDAADAGTLSLHSPRTESVNEMLLSTLLDLVNRGVKLRCLSDAEETHDLENMLARVRKCLEDVQTIRADAVGACPDTRPKSSLRIAESFTGLVCQSTLHTLATYPRDAEPLENTTALCDVLNMLIKDNDEQGSKLIKIGANNAMEGGDEEEDEQDAASMLADVMFNILGSSTGAGTTSGLRTAFRRLWTTLVALKSVSSAAVATVLDTVVAGSLMEDEDDEVPDDVDEHTENDEGEEDDDADDADDLLTPRISKPKALTVSGDDEEEVMILDEEELLKVLKEGFDDDISDDVDSQVLVHTEEADDALAEMIKVRQMTRKSGLLEAKRQEFQVRLRAIDILEVTVSREDRRAVLLSMMFPLLRTLRAIVNSNMAKSIQEGNSLKDRLRGVIAKVCKRSPQGKDDTVDPEDAQEVLSLLLAEQKKSTNPLLTNTVTSALLASSKLILSAGGSDQAKAQLLDVVSDVYRAALKEYMTKRGSKLQSAMFEEVISRFTSFATKALLIDILTYAQSARSTFLRSECFKLCGSIYSKYNTLSEEEKALLVAKSVQAAEAVKKSVLDDVDSRGHKTKRLKPALQMAGTVAQLIILHADKNAEGTDNAKAKQHLEEMVRSILATSPSPAVRQLCHRVEATLGIDNKFQVESQGQGSPRNGTKKRKGRSHTKPAQEQVATPKTKTEDHDRISEKLTHIPPSNPKKKTKSGTHTSEPGADPASANPKPKKSQTDADVGTNTPAEKQRKKKKVSE